MDASRIPNVELEWAERYERIRRVQARLDPTSMTRPLRDPGERRFLAATGQLGPYTESVFLGVVIPVDVPEE